MGDVVPDRRQFWVLFWATTLGTIGSAISAGVFFIIAVSVLDVAKQDVMIVVATASIVGAVLCIPLTVWANRGNKKFILVSVETCRAVTSSTIVGCHVTGTLALWHIAVALAVVTTLAVLTAALGGALVRQVVAEKDWQWANQRVATAGWVATGVFTPCGGLLAEYVGVTWPLVVNAVAYGTAALTLCALVSPPRSAGSVSGGRSSFVSEITSGWQFLFSVRTLRAYFLNAMWFGGCLALAAPLVALLVLRDMGLSKFQYSLILSVPVVAGLLGSVLSAWLVSRWGESNVVLISGAARSAPLILLACAPAGIQGFSYILACEFALMFAAGVFNPIFTTVRFRLVPQDHMVSVGAAWPITAHLTKPLFVLCGSLFLLVGSTRGALFAAGVLMLSAIAFLPWRAPVGDDPHDSGETSDYPGKTVATGALHQKRSHHTPK